MNNAELAQLVYALPDSPSENKIASILRQMGEERAFEEVIPFLADVRDRSRIALVRSFARSANQPEMLRALLRWGLEKKLVSEIGGWIRVLLPKIGTRAALKEIRRIAIVDIEAADIGIYHLQFHASRSDIDRVSRAMLEIEKMRNRTIH